MDNEMSLFIDGMSGNFTFTQDGSFNSFDISVGDYLGSDDITLSMGVEGDYNTANVFIGNTASTSDATINLAITGGHNIATIVENGTDGTAAIKFTNVAIIGDTNTISVNKSGAGLQLFDLMHTGNLGTFTATQSGTADNSATISTSGNNANFTVLQH
jgi:hypothetical protein